LDGHRRNFGRATKPAELAAFATFSKRFVALVNEMLRCSKHDKSGKVKTKGDFSLSKERGFPEPIRYAQAKLLKDLPFRGFHTVSLVAGEYAFNHLEIKVGVTLTKRLAGVLQVAQPLSVATIAWTILL
jgi:hypothetical protein